VCALAVWIGAASAGLAADSPAPLLLRDGKSISSPASGSSDPLAQPIPMPPGGESPTADGKSGPPRSVHAELSTLVGGLAVCVGAFLLFVWATRRHAPRGLEPLPAEVLEPLGRAPLNGRQYLQLVRLGHKLVLLCVSPQGATALLEISDGDEVARLAGLCQQSKSQSVTRSFREALAKC
jgi:flagellar biogenesis protein FliO